MNKKILVICLIIISLFSFTACNSGTQLLDNKATTMQYDTMTPLSVVEYTQLMNKQIAITANLLTAQMSLGHNLIKGSCSPTEMLNSFQQNKIKLNECINSIERAYPAKGYETDRNALLDAFHNVQKTFDDYESILISENYTKEDVQFYVDQMQNEYTILTSLSNVYSK